MVQNITSLADHVNAIVAQLGGTLVAGGFANGSQGLTAGSSRLALGGYHGDKDRRAPAVRGTIRRAPLSTVRSRGRLDVDVSLTEAGGVRVTAALAQGRTLGAVDVAFGARGKRTVRVALTARRPARAEGSADGADRRAPRGPRRPRQPHRPAADAGAAVGGHMCGG